MVVGKIRTIDGDIPAEDLGFTLSHEHLFADFGTTAQEADLDFTTESEIENDLRIAVDGGVRTIVEMSTYDMGCSPQRVAELARRVHVQIVKSTGWFRSPYAERSGVQSADAMSRRMKSDIESRFAQFPIRAGVIGEIGIDDSSPTRSEVRILDASADASNAARVGIVAHTDSWQNSASILKQLQSRGVDCDRVMLAHARCRDPLGAQLDSVAQGAFLAFDQLGHPHRDATDAVADRILALADDGHSSKLVVSADVGRRSRLTANGGSGYLSAVTALLRGLEARGAGAALIKAVSQDNIATFLALRS